MNTTPHAKRRNNCALFIVALVTGTIVFGCMKKDYPDTQEKEHSKINAKDSLFRLQGWVNSPKDMTCDLKY